MNASYAIGADEWYSVDIMFDPFGRSYADILVFGSKGRPKAYIFADTDTCSLMKRVLDDMDMHHVKIADIRKFKTEYVESALKCGCAEKPHTMTIGKGKS